MLFLVISHPRPERPSTQLDARKHYWEWITPLMEKGMVKSAYARTGRGAVVLFDVDSNESLHRLMNEWSDIIPAQMDVYPLVDPEAMKIFLKNQPA